MIAAFFKTNPRFALPAVVTALALAVPLPAWAESISAPQTREASDTLTPLGSYLAARHASVERDAASAAKFYRSALQADPRNGELIDRAFISAIAGGEIEEAVKFARQLLRADKNNRVANLVVGIHELKQKKYTTARGSLQRSIRGPITDLVGTLLQAWALQGEGNASAVELLAAATGVVSASPGAGTGAGQTAAVLSSAAAPPIPRATAGHARRPATVTTLAAHIRPPPRRPHRTGHRPHRSAEHLGGHRDQRRAQAGRRVRLPARADRRVATGGRGPHRHPRRPAGNGPAFRAPQAGRSGQPIGRLLGTCNQLGELGSINTCSGLSRESFEIGPNDTARGALNA